MRKVGVAKSLGRQSNWLDLEVQANEGEDEALEVLNQIVEHTQTLFVPGGGGGGEGEYNIQWSTQGPFEITGEGRRGGGGGRREKEGEGEGEEGRGRSAEERGKEREEWRVRGREGRALMHVREGVNLSLLLETHFEFLQSSREPILDVVKEMCCSPMTT